jgi:hypothetical protein
MNIDCTADSTVFGHEEIIELKNKVYLGDYKWN